MGDPWWVYALPGAHTKTGSTAQYTESQAPNRNALPAGAEFIHGPYTTKAQADAQLAKLQKPNIPGVLGIPGAPNLSLSSFLGQFTQRALWIRIAEATIGALLIIVGVTKLAGDSPIGKAAKTVAKKARVL
jgi:hypothetical protein